MKALEIRVAYDYVDPGSYLGARLLDRWIREEHRTVQLDWVPLELSVPPDARLDPTAPTWRDMHRAMHAQAVRAGIPLSIPSWIPWTRKAHELALHAREKGCFESVHRALFEAHFADSRDIGRIDVLVEIAAEQGLDPAEVRTVLGVDRFRSEVEQLREAARRAGIRGVPTFVSGGEKLEGLTAPPVLRAFLDELVRPEPNAGLPARGGGGGGPSAPLAVERRSERGGAWRIT